MKLFLASRSVHPRSLNTLEEYVHGFQGKSIAYIPTAANGEGYGSWKNGESWRTVQSLGLNVTLVQLEDYRDSSVLSELQNKDMIWMAGGVCGYLMYWIRRCELDKHIQSLLTEKVVYVGSSAGSMITAPTLNITEWFPNDTEAGASIIPALGLVDFDFYPHFTEDQVDYIQKHNQSRKLYMVKDGEALIVENNHVTVFGEARLTSKA